ncbi:MAG TPA: hypothetical protein VK421_04900 [Pyrinomonadaceae bacterium]|nr:hypothetical protein [Pyrinomonadaceae bacterium]
MRIPRTTLKACLLAAACLLLAPAARAQKSEKKGGRQAPAALWRDPGDISRRDLRYGPGSPALAPKAPFTFVKETKGGESPKFKVRDARGTEWSVKLGPEAQAETVATRLVWAVGYFAEEAYYFDKVRVRGMKPLSRGREYVAGDTVRGARFEPRRANVEEGPEWSWRDSPFEGTREMSGLKVLMILLNNYDARKGNNHILYTDTGRGVEARYVVTDLGATLGRAGGMGGKRSKNDLADFLSTKFVRGVDEKDGVVEFDFDTRPRGLFGHLSVLHPKYYRGEVKKEAAMRGIPVEHAAWIGSLLSRLSDRQLRDAFGAAHYIEEVAGGYVRALRERIGQLTRLRGGEMAAAPELMTTTNESAAAVGEQVASSRAVEPLPRPRIAGPYGAPAATFEGRVRDYVAMREALEDRMPRLSQEASAEEIEAHKMRFQEAVRAERTRARQGDIFTPEAMEFIRAAVSDEFRGIDRAELLKAVSEAETQGVLLRVNHPYPESKELLEMPPSLLLRLPQLPKQVKYRFVGRNLLLVDRENGLIIDYMTNALP